MSPCEIPEYPAVTFGRWFKKACFFFCVWDTRKFGGASAVGPLSKGQCTPNLFRFMRSASLRSRRSDSEPEFGRSL